MRKFGTLAQWHWVSSALCLIGMLMFAITGITLNHAQRISAQPITEVVTESVPDYFLTEIDEQRFSPEFIIWVRQHIGVNLAGKSAEWSDFDVYVSLPRPGGDAWLSIDFETAEIHYEHTKRGAIAYLNDLHKGRHTGIAWQWFLDLFAVACIVFTVTGLLLLHRFAKRRWSTWPLVTAGALLPIAILLLFVH
ncbi:MAG: PepSY-associated TM helix domain-containing protein [Aliidiomarina sp.]|uniref:PepSY-associated TM helix domain-containing protein n=1 Tax=Aliidiomarina sp. TaxID=1872439 RepID=UPI0025BD6005|nr:PepSY-associated TM helix domain-containing protein [Aliidiomarina sp.]MCH8500419.1 PepSY-associated TM helix domain-containing protein [Aliidiomarina sp.]